MSLKAKPTFLFLLAITAMAARAETIDGRVYSIADGDTLMVLDGANRQRKIQLIGIDAPALTQEFGRNARTALSARVSDQSVRADCRRVNSTDLCRVWIGEKDIALELVRAGAAWWNPQHTQLQTPQERADYQQAEFNAKIRRFGLWDSKNPTPPWQWRFP